jgi:hypothetical protein
MSTEVTSISIDKDDARPVNAKESFEATGDTGWVKFQGPICVQLTGTSTNVVAQVQRSTEDPEDTANPAPVAGSISGDLTAGVSPVIYNEVAAAWWRVVIDTLDDGAVDVSMTGFHA